MYDSAKLIKTAEAEVGYLEKKSNSQLDDKTANAGSNNFTKYGAEMGCNGQPWCDAFVDWCFKHTFGDAEARKLLGGYSNYTPTSAQYFKKMSAWHTNPEVGDIVFFKNSTRICHTGIVHKVDNSKVYTIEGNTSSKDGLVPNGGCVAKKTYQLTYSKIAGYGRPGVTKYEANVGMQPPTIKIGDKGNWVKVLQAKLISNGYKISCDGDFGPNTKTALIAYQGEKGLVKDGICGPNTWATIF